MKRLLYIVTIFSFGWVVLGFRMLALSIEIIYAVISACASKIIEFMIRSSLKTSNQPPTISGLSSADPNNNLLPGAEQFMPENLAQHDSLSSSTATLSHIAETLQMPMVLKLRHDIEALSAPVPEPRSTFHSIARLWLKFGILVSLCDSALNEWYLNRAALLQEHVATLNSHKATAQREAEADFEQQRTRSFELLPPQASDFQNSEHEMPFHASASIKSAPPILATRLRMRRPREPWTLLWGNLHVPKHHQVSFSHF
jgi:hypothetical protein